MSVVEVRHIDYCLDGSHVREFVLDAPLARADIVRLVQPGEAFVFLETLPKPFFKIEQPGHYIVKGVQGNRTLRVTLSGVAREQTQAAWLARLNSPPSA